ncbi:MAG TPA: radical SAM protein [Vicinamibacterales bacterium]|nr:radical SAM protein [Vicinamibacterales bacterium]
MRVHLVNPSDLSFGLAVITPRWLFVLAAATPDRYGTPVLVDETLERLDPSGIDAGDVVGISIHTGNALRGYAIGREARARGAYVVYGGIHATLYPDEARERGQAHAIVSGDGDLIWSSVLADCQAGQPKAFYDGGRVEGARFMPARWDLLPTGKYMWASVQTVRGCPKFCSFCSVWRTDGQEPRNREASTVIGEIVELRRRGFRFIALADDNFYPVSMKDLEQAARLKNPTRLNELTQLRADRLALMTEMAKLPRDMTFFTQITMEAAEDPEFLDAMRNARIRGALVGVESVTPEGLKSIYKNFNLSGDALAERLRMFRERGVHVLGSFIFGLPSDNPATFDATAAVAEQAGITFAQFVMLTPFPGTIDFEKWEKTFGETPPVIDGVPITRHWLIAPEKRPKYFMPHPSMSPDEIRANTQRVWDHFYSIGRIWERSRCVPSLRGRLAFLLISKLYRQMYANTGISTDSARRSTSVRWARWLSRPCQKLFAGRPMPELQVPS